MAFTIASKSWENQGTIARRYVLQRKGGQNVSPQFTVTHIPEGTACLLVVIVDHHRMARDWLHWVVQLPVEAVTLKEGGALPDKAISFPNTFGNAQYDGPAPPPGSPHDYHLVVFALKTAPSIGGRPTWNSILRAVEGQELARAEIVAYFESNYPPP